MKPTPSRIKIALAAIASLMSFQAFATTGPYLGVQFGVNLPGDQTYNFRGQHTTLPQPPVPTELPLIQNFGEAGQYKYGLAALGQVVIGDQLSFGLRPEFELSLRRDEPNSIKYSDGTSGEKKGVRLSSSSGMVNLWWDFFPSWAIHPYIGAGAGFVRFILNDGQFNPPSGNGFTAPNPRKADDMTAAFQGGAGINWDVMKHVTVGVDYLYFRTLRADLYTYKDQPETYVSASYKAQSVLLSVKYHFGIPSPVVAPPPEPVAVVPAAAPIDSDGDGVPDTADQCPNTPAGTKVGPTGCPIPPPCKAPEAGEKISLAGCGTGDRIILRGVNFNNDKATLTVNAKQILDNVVAELSTYSAINVEIDGHTDSNGSHKHNEGLSARRAESVKAYLVKMGVADSRITTAGFAETQPIADNSTDEGRELNRRVELKIVSGSTTDGGATSGGDSSAAMAPTAPTPDAPATSMPAPAPTDSAAPSGAMPAADAAPAPAADAAPADAASAAPAP